MPRNASNEFLVKRGLRFLLNELMLENVISVLLLNTFKPNVSFVFSCEYRDLRRGTRRGCKFGQEGSLSSAEYYLADSAGDSFSPAVNPRIKELIPFGQPKGCERFRVRIISRPGRREGERGERRGKKGKRA